MSQRIGLVGDVLGTGQAAYDPANLRAARSDRTRWLGNAILISALCMAGWAATVLWREPVTRWFAISASIWLAVLVATAAWQRRGSVISIAATALSVTVIARLFSILRLHPPTSLAGMTAEQLDLQVATGPGIPGFEIVGWALGAMLFARFVSRAADSQVSGGSRSVPEYAIALTFIRVYLGLMFVPHFASHILGGPFQFAVYTVYFQSLGLHLPAMQVLLAGTIELITAVALVLGLAVRPVALLGCAYLMMSMLWGGHFHVGYVWALPEGGYEFGLFWAGMIAVFAVIGAGPFSVDHVIVQRWRLPLPRVSRALFG